jgi:hypothetical protein
MHNIIKTKNFIIVMKGKKLLEFSFSSDLYEEAMKIKELLWSICIPARFKYRKGIFTVSYRDGQKDTLVFKNYMFFKIKSITSQMFTGAVYDFEIASVHEYRSPIGVYHNSENVNIDNVEVNKLRIDGEQTEDYGYFDTVVRQAAYDRGAYEAAITMKSLSIYNSGLAGELLPRIARGDGVNRSRGLPTTAMLPTINRNIQSNGHAKYVERNNDSVNEQIHKDFYTPTSHIDRW